MKVMKGCFPGTVSNWQSIITMQSAFKSYVIYSEETFAEEKIQNKRMWSNGYKTSRNTD